MGRDIIGRDCSSDVDEEELDLDDYFEECPECGMPVCDGCGDCHYCRGEGDMADEELHPEDDEE